MADIVIVFDYDVSLDSIFSAADYAAENSIHIIAPKESERLIKEEWTFDIVAKLYICSYEDRYRVLSSLLLYANVSCCFGVNSKGESEEIHIVSLQSNDITCLDDMMGNLVKLSRHNFFDGIELGGDFYTRLNFFLHEIAAVKTSEREMLQGKSKLSNTRIAQKVSATAIQLLGLDEFKFLDELYSKKKVRYEDSSEVFKYYSLKSTQIKKFYSNSFSRNRSLVKMSSFPVAYKYFSAFLYLSAQEMLSSGNYSSAYIMFFRCFEVYCEGLILSQSIGKIERFVDENNNVFEDCLIIKNKKDNHYKPMGFGGKWRLIRRKNLVNTMDMCLIQNLEYHIKMRNVNVLTHGDVFASFELLRGLTDSITRAIVYFEDKFAQTKFHWKDLHNSIRRHFLYDPNIYIGKMLLDEYQVKLLDMK